MSTLDTKTVERINADAKKIEKLLSEYYRANKDGKGGGYGFRLIKAGLTAEALRYKACVEALEKIAEEPYPEDIFSPLTIFEWKSIKNFLVKRGIPLDRLSAEYGRLLRKADREAATTALNNLK